MRDSHRHSLSGCSLKLGLLALLAEEMLAQVVRAVRQIIEIIRPHRAVGNEENTPLHLGWEIPPVEDIPIDHGNRAAR